MIRDRIKELRRVKASTLIPHPLNYRKHPARQKALLQQLFGEIGYADALLVRETPEGYALIDGHLRAETTPDQEVPVLVLDVTEQEANTLLLSLDPLAGLAETDSAVLASLLAQTDTQGELDAWLKERTGTETHEDNAKPPTQDEAAALLQKWQVAPDQLWLLGASRLYCGDATAAEHVARLLRGDAPSVMVTDPPYGVEYDANWRNEAAAAGLIGHGERRVRKVENDDRADWSAAWALFPGAVAYCWHADRHASIVQQSLESADFEIRAQIIWSKPRFALSRGHYHWQHEPCWYAVRAGATANWIGDRSQSTVWECGLDLNVDGGHSTQKPVELMARSIRNHSGDVYDPFSGSGSTLIACEQLNRPCYAMEISPEYCSVILERWHVLTGKTPVLS